MKVFCRFAIGGFCCSANDARIVRAAILSLCFEVLSGIHKLLVIISQIIFNRWPGGICKAGEANRTDGNFFARTPKTK